ACVADGAEIAGRRHRLGHAAALENHPTLNPTTEHCGDLTTLTLFPSLLEQGGHVSQQRAPRLPEMEK
ncbi:hypothetical protein ACMV5I_29600, partial [Serratia sp. T13T92]|uniref:hypothetical protein n=1 Tax=Serratia sp. T13T92 TaxID=3397496 RepID=UPI0039E1A17F